MVVNPSLQHERPAGRSQPANENEFHFHYTRGPIPCSTRKSRFTVILSRSENPPLASKRQPSRPDLQGLAEASGWKTAAFLHCSCSDHPVEFLSHVHHYCCCSALPPHLRRHNSPDHFRARAAHPARRHPGIFLVLSRGALFA